MAVEKRSAAAIPDSQVLSPFRMGREIFCRPVRHRAVCESHCPEAAGRSPSPGDTGTEYSALAAAPDPGPLARQAELRAGASGDHGAAIKDDLRIRVRQEKGRAGGSAARQPDSDALEDIHAAGLHAEASLPPAQSIPAGCGKGAVRPHNA